MRLNRISSPEWFRTAVGLCAAGFLIVAVAHFAGRESAAAAPASPAGALRVIDPGGDLMTEACPLKHTAVDAEISGPVARVRVKQEFENPFDEKIEAVYTFPLPQDAAVDGMNIAVDNRTIRGTVKRREEAREIYEKARRRGHIAGLLDQERPNIFTQGVANIPPKGKVTVEIAYVQTLRHESGAYEFTFPMVVGPRYIPGNAAGARAGTKPGGGWAPGTNRVPDASRITPPVTPPGTRAGHDLSIKISLDAGLPVSGIESSTHQIAVERTGQSRARIRLAERAVIPNKDFVLRYGAAGESVRQTLLAHRGAAKGGFFTLLIQPPAEVAVEDVTPKELIFVLDTSGSMNGFPIEKAKESMRMALHGLYPRDTFNLITFSGDTEILFPEPVPATKENLEIAQRFLETRRGRGGTGMMKAIQAALRPSHDSGARVRIACFMTDGYVGNDMEIIGEVKNNPGTRVFAFGIGPSVNRFLLEQMTAEGGGEALYVGLREDGSRAAREFHERVRNPLMTDVRIDWDGLPVEEIYPKRIPDVFSAKPVVVHGRYARAAKGQITLRGKMAGRAVTRTMAVDLPAENASHAVLPALWARRKVDHLMGQDWQGMQQGAPRGELREDIVKLGLEFGLATQFTSFVAVEERVVTEGGVPRRVEVPVEMPEGVSYEGVFGEPGAANVEAYRSMAIRMYAPIPGGPVGGVIGGISGGPLAAAPPPPPLARDAPTRPANLAPSKLHPALASLARGELPPAPGGVSDGKRVAVEIWLVEATPEILKRLESLGFRPFEGERASRIAKVRIGTVLVNSLERLAALEEVQQITPHHSAFGDGV